MTKINLILLDMDEVLVDFVGGACRLFRADPNRLKNRPEWDIVPYLGLVGLTQNRFWERINLAGEDFWLDLEELPWASDVLELCNQYAERVLIVTTPSTDVDSYSGKVKWLQRRFGRDFKDFCLFSEKELLAKPDRLLIDDNPDNCAKFVEEGGNSLVCPQYGNALAYYRGDMGFFSNRLYSFFQAIEEGE